MALSTPVLLIVEDELPLLQAIALQAERAGFTTITARTVPEAAGILKDASRIDVVWVDHFLAEHFGVELVQAMRHDKRWKTIPIFLVSNVIEPDIIQQYLKVGIQGYYAKMLMSVQDILTDIQNKMKAAGLSS